MATQDKVHSPDHYTAGGIETIDFIKAKLGDGFVPYCIGNVMKYISRYDKKGNPCQDLEKAQVYLGWAIKAVKEQNDPTIQKAMSIIKQYHEDAMNDYLKKEGD